MQNMALKLNIVLGSTRPGRVGPKIAQWVKQFADEHGKFDVELVDLAAFDLPLLDEVAHPRLGNYQNEPTKRWSASVASADAFVFVTPEYDYFAPASLVNAVQVLLKEWGYKPAGVVSYGGVSGGLRAAQSYDSFWAT
jgi:NAD(P)H-dependent FMN reductase